MNTRPARRAGLLRLSGRILVGLATVVVLIAVILTVGVGVVAVLARGGAAGAWRLWADVGEAFGVLNSVVSGLALAALVVTFSVQFQELRSQRQELIMQREALTKSQEALHRTAEANLRMLHVELLKLGIDDADLAAVWPPLVPGLPHEQNRQYLYANLIFQHVQLSLDIGPYSEARVEAALRYLFSSSLIRDYWRAANYGRSFVPPDTSEFKFSQMADRICREYENVCANHGEAARRQGTSQTRWDNLDADQSTSAA